MWRHAEIRVLPDIVRYWARATPHKRAVVSGATALDYATLDSRSNAVANALLATGVRSGDHVGYLGPNSVWFWVLWFGVAKAGAVLTPLNWRFAVPELVELVDDAGIGVVFADATQTARLGEVADRLGRPVRVVPFDEIDGFVADAPDTQPDVRVRADDIALMSYTSGTTGRPKGVQLAHAAFDRFFMMSSLEPAEQWSVDDTVLMIMPNFHLAGSWLSLPALYHGGTVAVVPGFDLGALADALVTHRPTVMCLVPTAIEMIISSDAGRALDFTSVRRLLYAGSPIRAGAIPVALDVLDCELMQFYGTSETYIISLLRPEQHRSADPAVLASCGQPFPFVDIRVVDADRSDVAAGDVGEVLVRSPTMFSGYWNRPDATAAVLRDGWYHTGDLGRRDDDGNLYLVDRLKDMIVTGGENVYSAEVEAALTKHPDVAAAAVVGLPDPTWGEAVTAVVVPAPGATPDADELIAHCRTLIAGYKTPKAVHVVDELPVTPSGKVRKHVLRDRLATTADGGR